MGEFDDQMKRIMEEMKWSFIHVKEKEDLKFVSVYVPESQDTK